MKREGRMKMHSKQFHIFVSLGVFVSLVLLFQNATMVEIKIDLDSRGIFERFSPRAGNFRVSTDASNLLQGERPFLLNEDGRQIPSFLVVKKNLANEDKLHSQNMGHLLLLQCKQKVTEKNFLSVENCENQEIINNVGYIFKKAVLDFNAPLYRCFNPFTKGFRVSTQVDRCTLDGYGDEKLLGYVKPSIHAEAAFSRPGFVVPPFLGYGGNTTGGKGGVIYYVTNLNDSGPGSLREGLQSTKGKRVIVFDVAGVIELKRKIQVVHPGVTVLGETAPSPGITLEGAGIAIQSDQVIIRHLRIHVGDRPSIDRPDKRDGISISMNAHNVVVDHNSIFWAMDEGLSTNGITATSQAGTSNISVTSNLIAEGLYKSIHPHGIHSMGSVISADKVSYIGNVYAHNNGRNPRVDWGQIEFVGNLVYNFGAVPLTIVKSPKSTAPLRLMVINNRWINGSDTRIADSKIMLYGGGAEDLKVFLYGNQGNGFEEGQWSPFSTTGIKRPMNEFRSENVLWNIDLSLGENASEDDTLAFVGARAYQRDLSELRILNEIKTRTGGFKNTPLSNEFSSPGESTWLTRFIKDDGFRHLVSSQAGDANLYIREVILGIISKVPSIETQPLYSCTKNNDTLFTFDGTQCANGSDRKILGYVHQKSGESRAPIFLCHRTWVAQDIHDSFLSKVATCENNGNALNDGNPLFYLEQPEWIFPSLSISANPPLVLSGQKTKLSWNSENTNNCQVYDPVSKSTYSVPSIGGMQTPPLTQDSTFSLTCSEESGVNGATQTVEFKVRIGK